MENVETKTAPLTDANDWRARYDSLQHLVTSLMVLLIVVSGTLWIFLRWQVKYTSLELEGLRPQATSFIAAYEKATKPAMDGFINKLAEYGRTHPDFAPIMTKYGIKSAGTAPSSTGASAAPALAAPAPTAPAAPAKKK